jgi:two-component system, NtrC family, response regulator PilR
LSTETVRLQGGTKLADALIVNKLPRILVVDDEESMCNFMEIMLKKEGYAVTTARSGQEAMVRIDTEHPDLVISDIMMPEMSGIELLTESKKKRDDLRFIVMTAYASVDSAVEALKKGADDYITKPFKIDEIKQVIKTLLQYGSAPAVGKTVKGKRADRFTLDRFVGKSEIIVKLKELVLQIAESDSIALILGESGTGKDLIARAIHAHSRRQDMPFVAINCAAIPEQLLESELFGHQKGSFTGAIKDKEGLFHVADGGVLFLDEIGNLTTGLQVKLLRVLETQEFTPVGSTIPLKVDVRLIAATNSDLEEDVKANRFRADLFYRLKVLPIHLPPLSQRREDIPLLAEYFLNRLAAKHNTVAKKLSPEAERLIIAAAWPGNVRELENTITRAFLLSKTEMIKPEDFPDKFAKEEVSEELVPEQPNPSNPTLESIEKAYIFWVLNQTGWQKAKAAKLLGIDASTLYRKIEKYGLKREGE